MINSTSLVIGTKRDFKSNFSILRYLTLLLIMKFISLFVTTMRKAPLSHAIILGSLCLVALVGFIGAFVNAPYLILATSIILSFYEELLT